MSTPTVSRRAAQAPRPARGRAANARGGMSPSRKIRGLALLGSLIATLVIVGLAAFSVLLWWVPIIGLVAVGASFLWLRSGVQAEISARRASARRRPGQPGRAQRGPARRAAARPSRPVAATERPTVAASSHESQPAEVHVAESTTSGSSPVSAAEQDPEALQTFVIKAACPAQ